MTARACPICAVPLEPEEYEGFRVLQCPQCRGHLVDLSRYKSIQRLPRKTLPELEAEAREQFQGDTPEPLHCPRCHFAMKKRPLNVPGFDLHMDVCRDCSLAWLDGGELAMAQLGHQSTPGFRDTQEMMKRSADLHADPERKAAFDEALAKLPEATDPFTAALGEAVREVLFSHRHPYGFRL